MVYEVIFILLLAVICFLLYKLYRIKYTEGKSSSGFISETWKKEMMQLDDDKGKELELRFEDIESRISDLEKSIKRGEKVIEKLVKELS